MFVVASCYRRWVNSLLVINIYFFLLTIFFFIKYEVMRIKRKCDDVLTNSPNKYHKKTLRTVKRIFMLI